MSINYKTPEYFRKFQCLGADCIDTCCQQWEVKLDRAHYKLLKDKMSNDKKEQALFNNYILVNEQPVTGDHDYAMISMAPSGMCAMLDQSGLCSLHAKYGVEPLGDVCAFYPRVISRCDNDMELSGALSCPEVARLCLLTDNPFKFSKFNVSCLPRPKDYPIQRELPSNPFDYYAQHFKPVRNTMLKLLSQESYSLSTRLYALAGLANRISSYYHRDCVSQEMKSLDDDLKQSLHEDNLNGISEYLSQDSSVNSVALIVIRAILEIKTTQFPDEKLSQLAINIYKNYQQDVNVEHGISATPIEDIQSQYEVWRSQLPEVVNNKIEQYFTRYLANCFFREWFFTMPDVFTYVQMLIIRLAIMRFLFISHPDLHVLVEKLESAGEQEQAKLMNELDSLAVHLVYNFARSVDQNLSFLQIIYTAVSEQQMISFDYSLPFVRL
jgi:lysine-N-methylase